MLAALKIDGLSPRRTTRDAETTDRVAETEAGDRTIADCGMTWRTDRA